MTQILQIMSKGKLSQTQRETYSFLAAHLLMVIIKIIIIIHPSVHPRPHQQHSSLSILQPHHKHQSAA